MYSIGGITTVILNYIDKTFILITTLYCIYRHIMYIRVIIDTNLHN